MTPVERRLGAHIARLRSCALCPKMHRPPVSGGPAVSKVILVGQAPGSREPIAGRPFAWTAGRTLFGWFHAACGMDESAFRASIYMAAVCRCFPGKTAAGGDRVPDPQEIENCSRWLRREIEILRPGLIIPVGRLAISRFIPCEKLSGVIGRSFPLTIHGCALDIIPLPHPSGASPWHRIEPGKSLLSRAITLILAHPAFPRPR